MSNLGIATTIAGFFVVQLCTIAFLFCMAAWAAWAAEEEEEEEAAWQRDLLLDLLRSV
jgi:hypothetical protein